MFGICQLSSEFSSGRNARKNLKKDSVDIFRQSDVCFNLSHLQKIWRTISRPPNIRFRVDIIFGHSMHVIPYAPYQRSCCEPNKHKLLTF